MAVKVNIDFDNVYSLTEISVDKRTGIFESDLADDGKMPLCIRISNTSHELLPDVYNIGFGPLNRKGEINDLAELEYEDYSKVFSTILLTGLNYLAANPENNLGVDGSTLSRAILYWRFIQRNFEYLDQYFNIYGLKYYVRISRFGKNQYDNPFDFQDILPSAQPIEKNMAMSSDTLFNYFIFNLKADL